MKSTEANSSEHTLGNSEIGIIVACTAGVFILALLLTLLLLCYKRCRYGPAYAADWQSKASGHPLRDNDLRNSELVTSDFALGPGHTYFSEIATSMLAEQLSNGRNLRPKSLYTAQPK